MQSIIKKRSFLFGAPLAIILAYVLIASFKIRFPGTHYDEALYLNAALGGVDKTTFITKTFHGFPILLMPYIGALKSYIFYPIFKIFGVSPITMRLPVILLTAAGLYVLYRLLNKQVGRRLSFCILAVTAINASFIMFTRLDFGPVVLDFLLKVIGLALLLRFVRQEKLWIMIVFWLVMLLGIFNKLNFIWYVNSFVAAFILVYGLAIWRKQKQPERLKMLALSAIGYLLCVGYYIYISVSYHLTSSFGFVGFHLIYSIISPVVAGSWFYNYSLSSKAIGIPATFWLVISIIIAGVVCFYWLQRQEKMDKTFSRFFIFTNLCLLLLLAQLAVTKAATAGWHYFSIYPLLGIVFVLSLVMIGRVVLPKNHNTAGLLIVAIVALFCIYQLTVYDQYVQAYGKTTINPYWSSAIYNLSDFTKAHKAPFVSLDWGTQTQLQGFDPVPNKYFEVFGPVLVNNPTQNAFDFQRYIATKPGAYYITHAAGKIDFPEVTRDFFILAQDHGYHKLHVATINDGSVPIFEIYQLQQ